MILPLPVRLLLWPLSAAYGALVRLRALAYARGWLKSKRLRGVVISVGNLTVGGTGKTPLIVWLAERLLAQGKRVAILSRGYRGSYGTSDEIELMKRRLGTGVVLGVGKHRFAQGKRLEGQGVDVFLLDDGFQHLQLARDLDIVLVDASRPLDGEWLLPAGRLREPIAALGRAGLIVLTRASRSESVNQSLGNHARADLFFAAARLRGFRRFGQEQSLLSAETLRRLRVFAFCGIGNPGAFFRDLRHWGVSVLWSRVFRDHHLYTTEDLALLAHTAKQIHAEALVCTEKDAQNLRDLRMPALPLFVAIIDLEISDDERFLGAIDRVVRAKCGAAA